MRILRLTVWFLLRMVDVGKKTVAYLRVFEGYSFDNWKVNFQQGDRN
jgi:hypothetical protein